MAAKAGFGRSVLAGVVAGVVVVAAAAAALVFAPGLLDRTPKKADQFVLVISGPGEDGATGGRIIVEVNAEPSLAMVSALDPETTVTIPGTTYARLSDAYAFGGGAEVVSAAFNGAKTPFVSLDASRFDEIVRAAGGLDVEIPRDIEVFDGDQLLSFRAGAANVDGSEALWLLQGARYLDAGERDTLRARVAEEALRAVSSAEGGIAGLVRRGEADSDVKADALPARTLP